MASVESRAILVAEDSDEDFDILKWAFAEAGIPNPLVRARSGEAVLTSVNTLAESEAGLPALVILDLNLIGMDGRAVLSNLKQDPELRKIPVLVFSTSDNPRDVESCYQTGANAYSLKPLDLDRFVGFARQIKEYWLTYTVLPRATAGRKIERVDSV